MFIVDKLTFLVAPNYTFFFVTDLICITFKRFTGEHSSFAEAFLFTLSLKDCLT